MPKQEMALTSYPVDAGKHSGHKLVNMYPEISGAPARAPFALYATPGMKEFADIPATYPEAAGGKNRGLAIYQDTLYTVVGDHLYSVTEAGVPDQKGLISGSDQVSMIADNDQLIIVTRDTATDSYLFDADGLSQISQKAFTDAAIIDGFGVYVQDAPAIPGRAEYSNANALATFSNDFYNAESEPDALVRILQVGRLLHHLGTKTTEPWWSQGGTPQFARHMEIMDRIGLAASNSAAVIRNKGFMLGEGDEGGLGIYRLIDRPERRSNAGIDHQIKNVFSTYSDALGFGWGDLGHEFFALTFPTAKRTIVLDDVSGLFHYRQSGVKQYDQWDAWNFKRHYSKDIVGHRNDGKLYELDVDTHTDAGADRLCQFTVQLDASGERSNSMGSVELDCETGVGDAADASNDVWQMRFSDDGGKNWSDHYSAGVGKLGDTHHRVMWGGGFGDFRQRILEFSCTRPIKKAVVQAWVQGSRRR